EEIRVADGYTGQEAVGGRIAAGDPEISGLLFLYRDVEHHPIRRRTTRWHDLHRFEIAKRLEVALAPINQRAIVGIALTNVELAADHFVAPLDVALHLDALAAEPLAVLAPTRN